LKLLILEILQSNKYNYVSGEDISKSLGVTRAAIWKYIKSLQEEGYIIESSPRKGYKLTFAPSKLSIDKLTSDLSENTLVNKILYFNTIESTNDYCKMHSENIQSGTIILTDHQLKGRGRFDRNWFSPQGKGIYCSIYLKPELSPFEISKITSIICASIIEVLHSYDIDAKVKWPNDIYLNNKKIGGILTEMKGDMDRINYLIIGFGLNINQESYEFPEEIRTIATSLKTVYNKDFNREVILTDILNKFEHFYNNFGVNFDFAHPLEIIRNNSFVINKVVTLIKGKELIQGKVINIGENGELIIERDGKTESIFSGEISLKINS
jgi:BirA family biotin operon repressor/biotin-[acetyl-CoA-carboxylase] ligase